MNKKSASARDIVVLGGSAGSAQALARILSALPENFPAAVVACVDAPLALNEASRPQKLAGLQTRLPWHFASNGAKLTVGTVLLLPPDAHGWIAPDGSITLSTIDAKGLAGRVDALLSSAATAFGPRVIGVVLSGDNTDGTEGLKAIERHGGMGIVQSPVDAVESRAPSHAVEADHPDCVAMLDQIPRLLVQWTLPR